jgi:hypothetical protein
MSNIMQTQISAPSKLKGKGTPPQTENASNNLKKTIEGETVALNFRVQSEFRKSIRQYALDHDTTAVQVMMSAVEKYIGTSVK